MKKLYLIIILLMLQTHTWADAYVSCNYQKVFKKDSLNQSYSSQSSAESEVIALFEINSTETIIKLTLGEHVYTYFVKKKIPVTDEGSYKFGVLLDGGGEYLIVFELLKDKVYVINDKYLVEFTINNKWKPER